MTQLHKETIIKQSKRNAYFLRIIYGMKGTFLHPWKLIFPTFYILSIITIWRYFYQLCIQHNDKSPQLWEMLISSLPVMFITLIILGLIYLFIALGTPKEAKNAHDGFVNIGFKNKQGEIPILLERYCDDKLIVYKFKNPDISLVDWDDALVRFDTVLKKGRAIRAEYGKNPNFVLVYLLLAKDELPQVLLWNDDYISDDDATLVLGESYYGVVKINLSLTPHILLGGSTASGKSALMKLILAQSITKGMVVYVADFKGLIDFNSTWNQKCTLVDTEDQMIETLQNLVNIMDERKELLRNTGCSNIEQYNSINPNNIIPRIIFGCDEIAEVLDKTAATKEQKEIINTIERLLSILSRKSRAFGIHLILATQRPSVDIISGQIRNNFDVRICGRADNILSQIILDNTDAASKIPKDSQGRFVNNNGELFQAYYWDDKNWNPK